MNFETIRKQISDAMGEEIEQSDVWGDFSESYEKDDYPSFQNCFPRICQQESDSQYRVAIDQHLMDFYQRDTCQQESDSQYKVAIDQHLLDFYQRYVEQPSRTFLLSASDCLPTGNQNYLFLRIMNKKTSGSLLRSASDSLPTQSESTPDYSIFSI